MELHETGALQVVLFRLDGVIYGLNIQAVSSFFVYEGCRELPEAPGFVRGVQSIRGQVITFLDLRLLMGMKSRTQEVSEFNQMLEQRKQDHMKWLDELERSVNEGREFALTTDPHQCAFGRWYDSYRAEKAAIRVLLERFDEPHRAIHTVGETVRALQIEGKFGDARSIIAATRDKELNQMIKLFDTLIDDYGASIREVAILLEGKEDKPVAAVVDEIVGIEELKDAGRAGSRDLGGSANYRICKRMKDDTPVILLASGWLSSLVNA